MKHILFATLFAALAATAQVKVTAIEKLPLPAGQEGNNPVFSPDGGAIYFTNSSFDGIWKYSRAEQTVAEVTLDPASGNGFTVSSDGSQIAYRRTSYDAQTHARTQDAVVMNTVTLAKRVVATGSDVSAPAFVHNDLLYSVDGVAHVPALAKSAAPAVQLLGIENTKISIIKNGVKTVLDPFGDGSYIWPALSPDGQKIVAYDLRRGTFVCDVNGTVLMKLGRRDAAVWTRDGNWLVYMNDSDDGRAILASDIRIISTDGSIDLPVTATADVLVMNPSCSPTENKIVCSANGALYVISYEETK
jgi:Tol biopolymer transport system component